MKRMDMINEICEKLKISKTIFTQTLNVSNEWIHYQPRGTKYVSGYDKILSDIHRYVFSPESSKDIDEIMSSVSTVQKPLVMSRILNDNKKTDGENGEKT